jgi:hypothetical protein
MRLKLVLFSICFCCLSAVFAQPRPAGIIQYLESSVPGEGAIQIESSSKITDLLGKPAPGSADEDAFVKINGFRIQVFMSNDPRTAKGEANQKRNQIDEHFPELATYVIYEAPNWKLLAGDFMTKEEAGIFKQKIQKTFPGFGKEMYTIPYKINIPKSN